MNYYKDPLDPGIWNRFYIEQPYGGRRSYAQLGPNLKPHPESPAAKGIGTYPYKFVPYYMWNNSDWAPVTKFRP